MSLADIVNSTITRDTPSVSRAGFSTINVMGIHKAFSELIKYYSSVNEVLVDFLATDKEAIAAANIFAQNPKVTRIAISRRSTEDKSIVTVSVIDDSTKYTVTINGVAFEFTSDADATNLEIAAGLVAAINGGAEPVTATDNTDGTFDIDPDVAGVEFTVKVDSRLTIAHTTDQDEAVDIADIQEQDDDWYGLVYTERTSQDVLDIAAYIETQKKIFLSASADPNLIGTTDAADTTTVSAQLKSASYSRTGIIYHGNAATIYPEAAWFGVILPLDPGSYTAAFKTLVGITVDSLTETQKKNTLDKNSNIYVLTGGENITRNGTVAEGEYIDTIVFIDWLNANIQSEVYNVIVSNNKVPYTDGGLAAIEAAITAVLQLGIVRGGIAIDPQFTVTVPRASEISAIDKAARTVNGITWQATLTGAIHAVNISGTVQV